MKNTVQLNTNQRRNIVIDVIRTELYTENEFPANLYPDLPTVLWEWFTRSAPKEPNYIEACRLAEEDEENHDGIREIARKVLNFQYLLEHNPQTIALLYRSYIKKFIRYQQSRSSSSADEWEDIFQEVITRLISGKLDRIREKFDFSYQSPLKKSTFTSYLMVTVRNIYMDIIRERQVRPLTSGNMQSIDDTYENINSKEENMLNRLVIEEEFRKLKTLLALHYRSRGKLELCLKIKCRVPVTPGDVQRCFPSCGESDMKTLLRDYKGYKDKQVFDTIIPVFNRNEGRENKSDTLRKWSSVKVDEIIAHLNRTHQNLVYTGKNFIDFITLYYERYATSNGRNLRGKHIQGASGIKEHQGGNV